jgi:two-component system CheB/CheR fusion protein
VQLRESDEIVLSTGKKNCMAKRQQLSQSSSSAGPLKQSEATEPEFPVTDSPATPREITSAPQATDELLVQTEPEVVRPERAHCGRFPVVGMGASAGGLEAFKRFLGKMPSDSGAAFVLIPHLDPTHASLMVELLARHTQMPVCEAGDQMAVKPNCVYIIPPNHYLAIVDGRLLLSKPPARHSAATAIDFFFRSLAIDQQQRAIGIILSGTSSHGTPGLKEIKLAGGMVMVQQPESAEYDQMPQSAIATGLVDFVLAPEQMPDALIKYLHHPYVRDSNDQPAAEESREQLNRILDFLRTRFKCDFRSYRKNMLLRRVQRRMGLCHLGQIADYLEYLREHPDEVNLLYKDLLIGVTDFFRDPEAFQVLQQRVIPELAGTESGAQRLPGDDVAGKMTVRSGIRVWIPACSTGEEAYSIGMLLIEQFASANKRVAIQIFATDIDERSLEIARQGIYSESSIAAVTPERQQRFFTRVDPQHWQVIKQLREVITFAPQNLISDAPFSKLDLICCRNLLIYLEPDVQAKVIRLFHFALSYGGFLLLGPSESIGRDVDMFEPVSKKWRVFRRIGPVRRALVEIPIVATEGRRPLRASSRGSTPVSAVGLKELVHRIILEEFTPAAVLINPNHEIVSVLGPTSNYLEFPPGEPTRDLLAMARPGLRTKIRAAVHEAIQTGVAVIDRGARVKRGGSFISCSITVKPMVEHKEVAGLLLVTFQDRETTGLDAPGARDSGTAEETQLVQDLEHELKSTREDLQSTIEEYEGSNEDLKASNEEVMSMNEELQSANEELETSKEELQSLNEELGTVNSQLQEKVEELDQSTDDLMNLMASSEVATVFLDVELRIKRFTLPVAKLLNLRKTDLGRPFSDLAPRFSNDTLLADCHTVLEKLIPIDKEVWTISEPAGIGGRPAEFKGPTDERIVDSNHAASRGSGGVPLSSCYLRRILPYRTSGNRIDGVVINFVNITQRILSEVQSRRLAAVLQDSNDAITVQDFDGQITAWNRGAERMYGYGVVEALHMNIRNIVPEDKRAELLACVRCLIRDEPVTGYQTRRVCKDGRILDVELTMTAYRDEHGRPIGVAMTERDITERNRDVIALRHLNETLENRVAEQVLRGQENLSRSVLDSLAAQVAVLNRQGVIVRCNAAWDRFAADNGAGDLAGVGIGTNYLEVCEHAADAGDELAAKAVQGLRGVLEHRLIEFTLEYPCHSEQKQRWFLMSAAPILAVPQGAVVSHLEITDRKQAEALAKDREERMRAVLHTAIDAIVTIDLYGVITTVNPSTVRMFGYPEGELVGSNVSLLMPQPYAAEHDGYIARYLKTGEARIIGIGGEVVGRRKDGSVFPVDLAVSQVDHLGLFTGIVRDISHQKALQKQVLEIAAEEQRRIGQELHDGTGQELTGLTLFAGTLVDLLKKLPRKVDVEKSSWQIEDAELLRLRQTAEKLTAGLVEANKHVQQLSHGIMPVQIEVEGLRSALEELAVSTEIPGKVACRFECPATVTVANNTAATYLYRIAQEAVNNALRHSGADRIRISLLDVNHEIILEVSDNGSGFKPVAASRLGAVRKHHGFGLDIMNYRAGIIGGTFRVSRGDEGGTVVKCVIPQRRS